LFSLGIPGNLAAALLIGAFMIHGVTPGPLLLQENGRLIYGIYGALMIANVFHLVIGLIGMRFFTKVLSASQQVLLPLVILISISGLYLEKQSLFPIAIMIIFTFIGFIMRKLDYSFITFIIGYVLAPLLESAFRQSMVMSKGNPFILLQRPISLVFVILTILAVIRILTQTRVNRTTREV
jgi:putative tricarboxylic transport membrane protein